MVVSAEALDSLRGVIAVWFREHARVLDLADAEAMAERVRRASGEVVFAEAVAQLGRKATYLGASIKCSCGSEARFVEYRERWVKSACGEAQVERAYYHCGSCKTGHLPWDREQGLNARMYTPTLKATVADVCGRLKYGEGTDMLARLGVVEIEESSAEDLVQEVGERLRQEEARRVEGLKATIEHALSEQLMCAEEEDEPVLPCAVRPVQGGRLYGAIDAASAHIESGWHNVQVGVVFTVRPGKDGRDTLWESSYVAEQTDANAFGWKLRTRAEEWNMNGYAERVVLGDGAPSNWNQAALHFPDATQVLDFYHVSEHLWALSRALYRQDEPRQKARGDRWVKERIESLKTDGPLPLLRALKRRKAGGSLSKEQQETLRKEMGYLRNNRCRMDYPAYLAAGMMIGSGPVEAACKTVVGHRMKQAGMRWSTSGADAILAVRTCVLNRDFEHLRQMARAA